MTDLNYLGEYSPGLCLGRPGISSGRRSLKKFIFFCLFKKNAMCNISSNRFAKFTMFIICSNLNIFDNQKNWAKKILYFNAHKTVGFVWQFNLRIRVTNLFRLGLLSKIRRFLWRTGSLIACFGI